MRYGAEGSRLEEDGIPEVIIESEREKSIEEEEEEEDSKEIFADMCIIMARCSFIHGRAKTIARSL